jgi:uncharacterized membrane protein YqjE
MTKKPGASALDDPQIGELPPPDTSGGAPTNWGEALAGLVASRVAIISMEAKDATASALGRLVPLVVGIVCLVGVWVLAMAGAVGAIAAATEWEWYHVAFAAAGIHLLIALIVLLAAKAERPAPFPVTRAEFEKDREWLNQLKNRNN